MRPATIIIAAILVIGSVFGIVWAGANGFGMRQAVEFFPYDDQVQLDDGRAIRSSGVVVRLNHREIAPTDGEVARLMLSAHDMYPDECSGANWEIAVRRPRREGGEEMYRFYFSIYETEPGSWIEVGRWEGDRYIVVESRPSDWPEITRISHGEASFQAHAD
jgi:hypothetical protein